MSIVAVKVTDDKIIIGADSITVWGYTQLKDKNSKLNKTGELIIGSVGAGSDGNLFTLFAKTRKPNTATDSDVLEYFVEFTDWCKKKEPHYKLESTFIIVFDKKAFIITDGYFVEEITSFMAIGAGMEYALAALYLGKTVEEAIDAACELSIYCERPINIMEVEK